MKAKTFIQFQRRGKEFFVKGTGSRVGANYILIAKLPNNDVLYAATIESGMSKRYQKNQVEEVQEIALVKPKGGNEKFLQIMYENGTVQELQEENYFVLFHLPNGEDGSEDYALIFNYPNLIGKGAHYQIFLADEEKQNAMTLFWMLKDLICYGG